MFLKQQINQVEKYIYQKKDGAISEKSILNKIKDYELDKTINYYYKYFKNRKSPAKYLLVIVKYLNGEGFIVTAYFEKNIK